MTEVQFKTLAAYQEYFAVPYRLLQMASMFCEISQGFGVTPVVTRVKEAVEGESGVHRDGRAIDFRDQVTVFDAKLNDYKSVFLYTESQAQELLKRINSTFPRKDGRDTIIRHSFQGGPIHFHLQVSYKDGLIPKPEGFGILIA